MPSCLERNWPETIIPGGGLRGGWGGGGGGTVAYLTLHCYHQNDFRIKTGSDESRFNAWFIVKSKVTRQLP